MKIFLIARGYPTPQAVQWGCFEKDQAEALVAAGHEVTILCYRQHPFMPYLGYWTHTENGVNVVSFCAIPGRVFGKFGSPLRRMAERWQLDMAYKKAVKLYGKPDIFYSHFLYISNNALYLKEKYNKPLIGIEHWSEVFKPTIAENVRKLATETYSKLNDLIVVSSALQKRIKEDYNVDSTIVHNMIGKEFKYAEKSRTDDAFEIVSIGDLIPRKCCTNSPSES